MSRPLDRVPPAMPAAPAVGEEQRRWERETRAPFLKAHPERREAFVTQALKWPIKPLYTPADLDASGFAYLRDLGFPGEYPFTRATQPSRHEFVERGEIGFRRSNERIGIGAFGGDGAAVFRQAH